jgi:hypothetical protein
MKIEECTIDEAFNEFVKISRMSKWKRWIYKCFHKHKFPICVRVDDSRLCPLQRDKDDDYLLTKHFLTIEEEKPGLYMLASFVTREAEGEKNQPYDVEYKYGDYNWPIRSLKHVRKMISDFIYAVNMTSKKT